MRPWFSVRAQIAVVGLLFVAALGALVATGVSIASLEARRASSRGVLERAARALAERGRAALDRAPRWPRALTIDEWDDLDQKLADIAASALAEMRGVEGGYYLDDFQRFLGGAPPNRGALPRPARGPQEDAGAALRPARRQSGPPPREFDLVRSLVDAAVRTGQPRFVIQDVPPSTVAIQVVPVWRGENRGALAHASASASAGASAGRAAAATWAMVRLVDPLFVGRSMRGFRLTAILALLGLALAMALTVRLARTIGRQNRERARLQAELHRSERLAALGKLLAGVAHEVRNPLAGIRASAQLWQRGIGPDEESIADVVAEVDRLETIVARLLHFSSANVSKLEPGDLNAIASEAARLVQPRAAAQNVHVELDLAEGLPAAALSAPELLQVFRNLTSNALRAMPAGGTLRLETRFHPGRQAIEADVIDTGPGLSAAAAAHLFEPFFTTSEDGTGLGLAIAREIALAHHGDLQASFGLECEQTGARFRIVLPVAETGLNREA